MKRIRIGNDVSVAWQIKENGVNANLAGRNLRLWLCNIRTRKLEITDYEIKGSVILFVQPGAAQVCTGKYSLVLQDATAGLKTIDTCDAWELVEHSCQADGGDSEGITTETVQLTSEMQMAIRGKSAYDLWLTSNHSGSIDDYFAYLRQPATEAADKVKVSEANREQSEQLRVDAESERDAKELARIKAEEQRAAAESSRNATFEKLKGDSETATKNANTAAVNAERISTAGELSEKSREQAEQLRVDAESERNTKELVRVEAEEQRAAAESSRNATFEKLKGDSETATEHANTAAENANNEAIAAKKITQTVQSKLDELAGATTAIINISLSSNQANDDLTGKKIYVKSESGSIINTVTYTGTMLSIIIKSNTSFYVQAEPLSGYKQPQSETLTALASNTYAIDLVYKAELLSVTVTGPSDGVFNPNTVVVKINGVSYNGNATVKIPFGTTYTIIATKATGYISPASFSALIAENNTRNIILEYKASKFGVFIADIEKKLYTVEEYKASPLDASRVLGVAVITESYQFVCRFNGKSSIWQASGVLISGAASTDEVANTEALIAAYDEGDVKACVPAWYCHNFIFNNGERGFLPGVGVAQTIMLNAINDALVTIGDTKISNNIWTSVQANAGGAYYVNSSAVAGNNGKGPNFQVVPCLLF